MADKVSFIIATVDRDLQLQECIDSIEDSHVQKPRILYEIIIVVQKAVRNKNLRFRFPEFSSVHYIEKTGLSAARNYAIAASTGDFLVFIDDDAQVAGNFLDEISKLSSRFPNVRAFCGRICDKWRGESFSSLFENPDVKELSRFDFQYFMGSAHVLTRAVLDKIGYYDERFGVGSGFFGGSEETDIFFRLKIFGEKVLYVPDILFFHPVPVTPPGYVGNYAHSFAAALAKSCFADLMYFWVYMAIFWGRIAKALVRLIQRSLFGGKFREMDRRYHYGALIRGSFRGIKDFLFR